MVDLRHIVFDPDLDMLDQGGWVLVGIALASIVAWTLIFWEWLRLRERTSGGWTNIEQSIADLQSGESPGHPSLHPTTENFIGKLLRSPVIQQRLDRPSFEAQVMPLLESETVMFERAMRVIAALAASMPLLGLLGTVLGMIQTFGALTDHGVAEIDALAGGISQALITTQAGLVIAVPVLLTHGLIRSRIRQYLAISSVLLKRIETIIVVEPPVQRVFNSVRPHV